jgi:thiosulfate reductase cytochrome b subunit
MTTATQVNESTEIIYRHRLGVRISHWVNALAFCFLVVSGIGILMAHPALYWGNDGYYDETAWLTMSFLKAEDLTSNWGRNYHFLFAWVFVINGLIYLLSNLLNRHFRSNLLPTREQLTVTHIMADIRDHLRFQSHAGGPARQYNFLQKFFYLLVIFVLCPLIVLSGLSMSPAITSVIPELLDLFGGRQSGRSIHFISTSLLVVFFIAHIVQVILYGFVKETRAMITGRIILPKE